MLLTAALIPLLLTGLASHNRWHRAVVVAAALGTVIFTGVGIYTTETHADYPQAFVQFMLGAALGVALARLLTPDADAPAPRVTGWLDASLRTLTRRDVAILIIAAYLFTRFAVLLYPSVRIGQLIPSGELDLTAAFAARFDETTVAPGGAITRYGATLLFPLFVIALSAVRSNLPLFCAAVLAPSWFQYASDSYISRGELLLPLLLILGNLWLTFPRSRVWLAACGTVAAPVVLLGLARFAVFRLGGDASAVDLSDAISLVAEYETSLPGYAHAVFDESQRADLGEYFKWIATLPVPKTVTGELSSFRLNYEIAELALGAAPGAGNFFVFLTGVVTESVYLFGERFNWLHGSALFFGLVMLVRFGAASSSLDFLRLYILYLAVYAMPRGGVSSVLPPLTNGLLGLYLVLLGAYLSSRTPRLFVAHGAR